MIISDLTRAVAGLTIAPEGRKPYIIVQVMQAMFSGLHNDVKKVSSWGIPVMVLLLCGLAMSTRVVREGRNALACGPPLLPAVP